MKTPNEKNPDWLGRLADSCATFGLGYLILSDRSIHSSNMMAWGFFGIGSLANIAIWIVQRKRTSQSVA